MEKITPILRNINVLNIVLLSLILSMANYSVLRILYPDAKYAVPFREKRPPLNQESAHNEFSPPSPTDYLNIAEDNLFHPERRIPPEKIVEPELPKPDFVLYGTMISDDVRIAYLEDLKAPRSTPGRGKRQIAVKNGDSLSGFILSYVDNDRIVMMRGEEYLMVQVMDKRKPKMRGDQSSLNQGQIQHLQPDTQRRGAPAQKPQDAAQPTAPPKDKPLPIPPRSGMESAIYDYFNIGR